MLKDPCYFLIKQTVGKSRYIITHKGYYMMWCNNVRYGIITHFMGHS